LLSVMHRVCSRSWPHNSIVFASLAEGGISRVPGDGGEPEALTRPDLAKGEAAIVLFTSVSAGRKCFSRHERPMGIQSPGSGCCGWKSATGVSSGRRSRRSLRPTEILSSCRRGILMAPSCGEDQYPLGKTVPVVDVSCRGQYESMRFETTAASSISRFRGPYLCSGRDCADK